jgi:hypothetical protein
MPARSARMKFGILLILIGMCLPIISIAFTNRYIPRFGLITNIQRMEIVLRKERKADIFDEVSGVESKKKIAIPYRYLFALGTLMVFTGIGTIVIIAASKR